MKNETLAKREFEYRKQKAADGDPRSAAVLGAFYRTGYGTASDLEKAVGWFEFADAAKNAHAAFNLAEMYDHGGEINTDLKRAATYYRRAASYDQDGYEDGLSDAMRIKICERLSAIYADSNDVARARVWGNEASSRKFDRLNFIGVSLSNISDD
jgi:hypothetical protein